MLRRAHPDVIPLADRYTLADQSALDELLRDRDPMAREAPLPRD